MTASGVYFARRMMRLAGRVAPFRKRPRRKVPESEEPAGPKLVVGRGWHRTRPKRTSASEYCRIVFWTLAIYGLWTLWHYMIFGWR